MAKGHKSNLTTMHTVEMYKLCVTLHWAIGYQAIYTSLQSAFTLRVLLSTTGIVCCWKKWLVHVRIHDSVWKIFFNVVTFFECAGVGFFSFAWNFSVIFLQQKRNSDIREMLYKMNDIKYKNRINNFRCSSWIGIYCVCISYIIRKFAKANIAKPKLSMMLKQLFL